MGSEATTVYYLRQPGAPYPFHDDPSGSSWGIEQLQYLGVTRVSGLGLESLVDIVPSQDTPLLDEIKRDLCKPWTLIQEDVKRHEEDNLFYTLLSKIANPAPRIPSYVQSSPLPPRTPRDIEVESSVTTPDSDLNQTPSPDSTRHHDQAAKRPRSDSEWVTRTPRRARSDRNSKQYDDSTDQDSEALSNAAQAGSTGEGSDVHTPVHSQYGSVNAETSPGLDGALSSTVATSTSNGIAPTKADGLTLDEKDVPNDYTPSTARASDATYIPSSSQWLDNSSPLVADRPPKEVEVESMIAYFLRYLALVLRKFISGNFSLE